MKKNSTLPKIISNEINLFTSVKNINKELVMQVAILLTNARKVKVQNAESFDVYITKSLDTIDLDTFMYLVDMYNFTKPRINSSYDNKIYFESDIAVNEYVRVRIHSIRVQIELMPNDIKKKLIL